MYIAVHTSTVVFISKEDPLTRENTMNLRDAARKDLAENYSTEQLQEMAATDRTGLVAAELASRSTGPTRDEVIAQPNS
jgi:hypothetical protein